MTKISIITINYNDLVGLEKTFNKIRLLPESTKAVPIEINEVEVPVRFLRYGLQPDTAETPDSDDIQSDVATGSSDPSRAVSHCSTFAKSAPPERISSPPRAVGCPDTSACPRSV